MYQYLHENKYIYIYVYIYLQWITNDEYLQRIRCKNIQRLP